MGFAWTNGKGATFPFQGTVSVPPINVFGQTPWQVGGAQSQTVPLTFTAWSGFQTKTFSVALTGFPSAITLSSGAQAVIQASVVLVQNPGIAAVFSMPLIQVVYGSGSTLQAGGQGNGVFSLQAGRKYTNLTLTGSVTAYAPGTVAQTIVYFAVTAVLLGLAS
jgi:hypothetical protein